MRTERQAELSLIVSCMCNDALEKLSGNAADTLYIVSSLCDASLLATSSMILSGSGKLDQPFDESPVVLISSE
jgi:hypothetical protein